jgi:hypothetical protein
MWQIVSTKEGHKTSDLYLPTANLTIYQKGVYFSGFNIYNHLPTVIKDLSDDKSKFKLVLKRYPLHNSFYSLEKYFNTQLTATVTLFVLMLTFTLIILL